MKRSRVPISKNTNKNMHLKLQQLFQKQNENESEVTDVYISYNPKTYETLIWCGGEPLRPDNPLLKRTGQPIQKWVDTLFDDLFFTSNADRLGVFFYGSDVDYRLIQKAKEKHNGDITLYQRIFTIKVSRNPYLGIVEIKFGSAFSEAHFSKIPSLPDKSWSTLLISYVWKHSSVNASVKIIFNDYDLYSRDYRTLEKKVISRNKIMKTSVIIERKSSPYKHLLDMLQKSMPSLSILFATVLFDILNEVREMKLTGKGVDNAERMMTMQPIVYFISDNDNVSMQFLNEMKNQQVTTPPNAEQYRIEELQPDYKQLIRSENSIDSSGIYSPYVDAIVIVIRVKSDSKNSIEDEDFTRLVEKIKMKSERYQNLLFHFSNLTVNNEPLNPDRISAGGYDWSSIADSYKNDIVKMFDKIKYMHYLRVCKVMLEYFSKYSESEYYSTIAIEMTERIKALMTFSQEEY